MGICYQSHLINLAHLRGGYNFLINRTLRLFPPLLVATLVALIWGGFCMLPYSYSDLAQNVIATNLFANNILMSIKSSDYWNVLNDYKPLMHTWYLGVLFQCYVIIVFALVIANKAANEHNRSKVVTVVLILLFCISLGLYLFPSFSTTSKFYFAQFRLFEICYGGLIARLVNRFDFTTTAHSLRNSALCLICYALLLILLLCNNLFGLPQLKLLLTVSTTGVLLALIPQTCSMVNRALSLNSLAIIGSCCYSIYIWHQIVFAFCRYSVTSDFTLSLFLWLMIIIGILSFISYRYLEKGMSFKGDNLRRNGLIISICLLIANLGSASYIYAIEGVVRDVPELDISKSHRSSRMHIAYNERGYEYDRDFQSTDKIKWLVIGDSYGRDMVNIILESKIEDTVEVSYLNNKDYENPDNLNRVKDADLIFRTMSIVPDESSVVSFYDFAQQNEIDTNKIRIVGGKRFGYSCGQVYARRNSADYYQSTLPINHTYFEQNAYFKEKYGSNFIDLITPVTCRGQIRVFTDDNKIISQDCEHLTQNGAKYYSRILKPILNKEIKLYRKKQKS